jgi:hypothetical protein
MDDQRRPSGGLVRADPAGNEICVCGRRRSAALAEASYAI